MKQRLKSAALITGILVAGIGVAGLMSALRAEPPREDRTDRAPLVSTQPVSALSGSISVVGSGTVRPTREITLSAQVPGRISYVSPSLVSGGRFRTGEVLLRVESQDFENAVAVARAEVTQREVDLLRAQEEVSVAREEWERARLRDAALESPDSTSLGRLVFREPQLKLAQAALEAAQARLADAELALGRTEVTAPFPGLVRAKLVDLGQYLAPGQGVASIYGTGEVEIVVDLSPDQMDLVDPSWRFDRRTPATVSANLGERTVSWEGYVHRVEGALDPATRQVNVVVRVPNPYAGSDTRPPLLVGTFAEVALSGRMLDRYFEIPRSAIRDRDDDQATAWMLRDGALSIQPVEVLQRIEDQVLIRSDAAPDRFDLILTDLAVVTDGMAVRTQPPAGSAQ